VTAIAPSADVQSRVFSVEVTLQNPDRRLRPGMIASVNVSGAEGRAGPSLAAVPLSSVVRSTDRQGGYAVFVIDEEGGRAVARARDVELGDISGNLIAVTRGLRPSERVIVTGATLVSDGERVRVIE
jgi:multidrug efflux system membrane fusion protein